MRMPFTPHCLAALCMFFCCSVAAVAVDPENDSSFILTVPGDLPEMIAAARDIPALDSFSRDGYLSIMCGYQAILKGKHMPIAPAPHIPWAKPYAPGPVKVLAITMFGIAYVDTRQIAQMARELDCDMRYILIAYVAVFREEHLNEEYRVGYLAEEAREALKEDYDVILMALGSTPPLEGDVLPATIFPDDIYETIKSKVRQGTGLVFTGSDRGKWWADNSPLQECMPALRTSSGESFEADVKTVEGFRMLEGTPLRNLPGIEVNSLEPKEGSQVVATQRDIPLVVTGKYGAGRTLMLGWAGTLSPVRSTHRSRLQYEHAMAITLRAITWAANAEPPVHVRPHEAMLEAGRPGHALVRTSGPAQLHCTLRDENFSSMHHLIVPTAGGDTHVSLPAIPAGRYWLDVIARDEAGASLGWGSGLVEARSESKLVLQSDTDVYAVGETVQLDGTLDPVPVDSRLEMNILDAAGRLLAVADQRADAAFQFTYTIADARVAPHTAQVTCYLDGAPLVKDSLAFYVPNHGWDDYHNILWPEPKNHPPPEIVRDVAGITAIMGNHETDEDGRWAAPAGIRQARMNAGSIMTAEVQIDPKTGTTRYDHTLEDAIESSRKFGTVSFALQDERHQTKDPGMPSEEGLSLYRIYLEQQYGSLDALNREWDSSHGAWSDVMPTLTADLGKETANLAPWVDFRLFVADQMYKGDQRHARRVKEVLGEDVFVGLDGFTTSSHMIPYGGTDIGRLLTEGAFNFYCPYEDDLMIASLVQGRQSQYIGSHMSRDEYFGLPWRGAFRGHGGSFRYNGRTFFSQFGWVQPPGNWIEEGSRELRHGVGRALIGARRQLQPVAFLYSYPSILTTAAAGKWVNPNNTHLMWYPANKSRLALEQMLLKCGVSAFRYLTTNQVEAGALQDVKLLVISHLMGMALSDETIKSIEAFVRDGGLVVADLAPAVCDEHGRLREHGGLDELFGVTRSAFAYANGEADYTIRTTVKDPLVPENAWFVGEWFEQELSMNGGKALGKHWFDGAPAFVVKDTGSGRAMLLNMLHTSTVRTKGEPDPREIELMDHLLRAADVKPWALIETDTGAPAPQNYEVNLFKDGRTEYVGVYCSKSPENPESILVRFPDERHTYDVLRREFLGKVDVAPLAIRAFGAALFARCDQPIEGIQIEARDAAPGKAVKVIVNVDGAVKGRQVVRLEVVEPDGKENFFYTKNVDAEDGQYEGMIHTAVSDMQGKWTVRARDIISGKEAATAFTLK